MRLITVQDEAAYNTLVTTGILRCEPNLATWLQDDTFLRAYAWMVEQMKAKIEEPPKGVAYPIWAWYLV